MIGKLECYAPKKAVFLSGDTSSDIAIVLIGGLTDGPLTLPYCEALNSKCTKHSIALVQPILSSSYLGFGCGSLDQDAAELSTLISFLRTEKHYEKIFLIGHSTGCQDIVHMARTNRLHVDGVILQGPVSDREYLEWAEPGLLRENLPIAKALLDEGKPDSILPNVRLFDAPITAYRFWSLAAVGGDDDMFSSGLPGKDRIVSELNVPCSIVMSGMDQFVPPGTSRLNLLDEFQASNSLFIPEADHSMTELEDLFVDYVFEFISAHF